MDAIPGVEIWRWCPRVDVAGQIKTTLLKAQFGDGYAQVAAAGINNVVESWPLQFVARAATAALMAAFLRRHAGYRAFHWQPPLSELGLYRCETWSIAAHGGRRAGRKIYTLSVTFDQAFRP